MNAPKNSALEGWQSAIRGMNEPTIDHSCSYHCDRPDCIKAQRDELRDKLAALESQPVTVEPEIPTVYYVTIPTGEYASVVTTASLSKWRAYINTMQSALHRAQENVKKWQSLAEGNIKLNTVIQKRAEKAEAERDLARATRNEATDAMKKAESINRRMVELLKRLSFLAQTTGGTAGRDDELVKAIDESAELLKEVEK